MTVRIVTWNLERKKPGSPKGSAAVRRIRVEQPDIGVLTEAWIGHLGRGGHEAVSQPTPSPGHEPDERKVVMWSRTPWTDVDEVGHPDMPVGRYVAGTTDTAVGPVRVMGICIPWHMCDVVYGSKDRKPWEQHLRWLASFGELVADRDRSILLIVAGDFNQRVPSIKGNKAAAEALVQTLADPAVVTAGTLPGLTRPGIDHIAVCPLLAAEQVWGWPRDDGGIEMTDHDAAAAVVAAR